MKFSNARIEEHDTYVFEKRNENGLSMKLGKLGDVWKGKRIGRVYKDNFFYVERDFGWIQGIEKSHEIKSLVKGVGLKVIKDNGESIVADKEGIKWNDLRKDPSWVAKVGSGLKKKKEIRVQRVAFYQSKSQAIDLNEGTCVVNVGARGSKDVYLIIGFADLKEKDRTDGMERISWSGIGNNFLSKDYGCNKLGHNEIGEWRFRLDNSWKLSGSHVASSQSLIVLGNKQGIYKLKSNKGGENYVVGVVLGLAYNKAQMVTGNREEDWKKILNDSDTEWRRREWQGHVGECLGGSRSGGFTGIKGTCLRDRGRIDTFKKWQANVNLTYSYEVK